MLTNSVPVTLKFPDGSLQDVQLATRLYVGDQVVLASLVIYEVQPGVPAVLEIANGDALTAPVQSRITVELRSPTG